MNDDGTPGGGGDRPKNDRGRHYLEESIRTTSPSYSGSSDAAYDAIARLARRYAKDRDRARDLIRDAATHLLRNAPEFTREAEDEAKLRLVQQITKIGKIGSTRPIERADEPHADAWHDLQDAILESVALRRDVPGTWTAVENLVAEMRQVDLRLRLARHDLIGCLIGLETLLLATDLDQSRRLTDREVDSLLHAASRDDLATGFRGLAFKALFAALVAERFKSDMGRLEAIARRELHDASRAPAIVQKAALRLLAQAEDPDPDVDVSDQLARAIIREADNANGRLERRQKLFAQNNEEGDAPTPRPLSPDDAATVNEIEAWAKANLPPHFYEVYDIHGGGCPAPRSQSSSALPPGR